MAGANIAHYKGNFSNQMKTHIISRDFHVGTRITRDQTVSADALATFTDASTESQYSKKKKNVTHAHTQSNGTSQIAHN